jgi:hypothetical protein
MDPQELETTIKLKIIEKILDTISIDEIIIRGGIAKILKDSANPDLSPMKDSSHISEKFEMLKDANRLLNMELSDRDSQISRLSQLVNEYRAKVPAKASIADLEKEFKVDVNPHGCPIGEVKVPGFIPNVYSSDAETIKRIDQNLGIVKESKIDDHLNESIKTCFKQISANTEVKINSFTKVKDGKLNVIVVQDGYKDGVLVSRKVLQDWSEVIVNPKEDILSKDNG